MYCTVSFSYPNLKKWRKGKMVFPIGRSQQKASKSFNLRLSLRYDLIDPTARLLPDSSALLLSFLLFEWQTLQSFKRYEDVRKVSSVCRVFVVRLYRLTLCLGCLLGVELSSVSDNVSPITSQGVSEWIEKTPRLELCSSVHGIGWNPISSKTNLIRQSAARRKTSLT